MPISSFIFFSFKLNSNTSWSISAANYLYLPRFPSWLCNTINTCIFSPFLQDLYVYVSQEEVFSDFNNTEHLFWFHRDMVYGDWTTGENGDGCYEQYKEMEIPEVGITREWGAVWEMSQTVDVWEEGTVDVSNGQDKQASNDLYIRFLFVWH